MLTDVTAATTASLTVSSSSNISWLATSPNLSSPPSLRISLADSGLRQSLAKPEMYHTFSQQQTANNLNLEYLHGQPYVPAFCMHLNICAEFDLDERR